MPVVKENPKNVLFVSRESDLLCDKVRCGKEAGI